MLCFLKVLEERKESAEQGWREGRAGSVLPPLMLLLWLRPFRHHFLGVNYSPGRDSLHQPTEEKSLAISGSRFGMETEQWVGGGRGAGLNGEKWLRPLVPRQPLHPRICPHPSSLIRLEPPGPMMLPGIKDTHSARSSAYLSSFNPLTKGGM